MNTFGPAYSEEIDGKRLRDQHHRIRHFMGDESWRTLAEISKNLGYPEASVSAQLRHLRKLDFGNYRVEKRRRNGAGTWEYRVLSPSESNGQMRMAI